MKQYPSQDKLKELFDYDPEGFLVWKERADVRGCVNARFAGEVAGCRGIGTVERDNGFKKYAEMRVNGKIYRQHVLVWIWHNGIIPDKKTVTHKVGKVLTSKIEELVLSENPHSKPYQHSRRFFFGLVGVQERQGKFKNSYTANDSEGNHIGTFTKEEAAAAAYNDYAQRRWGDDALLNDVSCPNFEEYKITSSHGGQTKKRNNGRMLGCYIDKRKKDRGAKKYWYSKLKNKHLGLFYSEEETARAYNIAAREYYGGHAILNDIPDPLGQGDIF